MASGDMLRGVLYVLGGIMLLLLLDYNFKLQDSDFELMNYFSIISVIFVLGVLIYIVYLVFKYSKEMGRDRPVLMHGPDYNKSVASFS